MNEREDIIDDALSKLLTPDGKGRKRKAIILKELCTTCNANRIREKINKMLDNNQFK